MLRVTDARSGAAVELATGSAPLRVAVRLPGTGERLGPAGLRVAVAGDVLARVAELEGRQVVLVRQAPERQAAELAERADQLRLYPAEAALDAPPDVVVAAPARSGAATGGAPEAADPAAEGPGVLLAVGAVHGDARLPAGVDPLALRLVLLRHPRTQPFTLTAASLADAEVQLGRWRRKVAEWANHPSRPVPAELRTRYDTALSADLDVPAVLRLLDEVESANQVADGARFELFAFADRVLGVELVREIGRW